MLRSTTLGKLCDEEDSPELESRLGVSVSSMQPVPLVRLNGFVFALTLITQVLMVVNKANDVLIARIKCS